MNSERVGPDRIGSGRVGSHRARVVLVGLGPTTATALSALEADCDVVALMRDGDDEVIRRAKDLGAEHCADTSIAALRDLVHRRAPDIVVVSSYHRILPADLLEACPFVNVHYAPLPRYRGRATVNWAIINGEPDAWISIHSLVPGLDAGGILHQERVPIGPRDTVTDLYERLNHLQREALAGAVRRRLSGDHGEPQDESAASYACTRVPDDGDIDWAAPTLVTDRLIRALAPPFPGAYTFLETRRLWIRAATPRTDAPRYDGRVPGRVISRSTVDGWVDVLTGDGVLRLHEVAFDGQPPVPAAQVLRSVKQTLGLRAADLLARDAELLRRVHDLEDRLARYESAVGRPPEHPSALRTG